jgi:hypothetical protein
VAAVAEGVVLPLKILMVLVEVAVEEVEEVEEVEPLLARGIYTYSLV